MSGKRVRAKLNKTQFCGSTEDGCYKLRWTHQQNTVVVYDRRKISTNGVPNLLARHRWRSFGFFTPPKGSARPICQLPHCPSPAHISDIWYFASTQLRS